MSDPTWVLDEVVMSIHQMLLAEHGGGSGARDMALLESALARPKQRLQYEPGSSLFDLAAAYSFGLAKNHPFIDGNKRIAMAIGAVFLEINGVAFNAVEAEAVVIFEQLASGEVGESALAIWYRSNCVENAAQVR